jgi:4a-hydroxytetrahydrobiopterin dehydratase
MTDRILSRQFHGAEGAEAWRLLPDGAYAFFRTDSFSMSARFVEAISGLAREGDAPDIDIRAHGVTV